MICRILTPMAFFRIQQYNSIHVATMRPLGKSALLCNYRSK